MLSVLSLCSHSPFASCRIWALESRSGLAPLGYPRMALYHLTRQPIPSWFSLAGKNFIIEPNLSPMQSKARSAWKTTIHILRERPSLPHPLPSFYGAPACTHHTQFHHPVLFLEFMIYNICLLNDCPPPPPQLRCSQGLENKIICLCTWHIVGG